MKNNKIAVIGGTGKSGSFLVKRLLKAQYRLRLLVRNPDKTIIKQTTIDLVEGDARDYKSVLSLVEGCSTIISTLGQPKGEPPVFSQASKNIVKAMVQVKADRYIVTTGLNVNTPFDKKSDKVLGATQWMYDNFPDTTRDKQMEYYFLAKTNIRWTMVRLPLIQLTDEQYAVDINLKNCIGDKISSTDLADFLIDQITDETFIGKSPFLSNI